MARTPECVIIDPDPGSRADSKRAVTLAHFAVVGEAGYGIEAITVANANTPDFFLVSAEEPVARALQTMESLGDALLRQGCGQGNCPAVAGAKEDERAWTKDRIILRGAKG